jgi:hypothetical protein
MAGQKLRVELRDPNSGLLHDVVDVVATTLEEAVEKAFDAMEERVGAHANEVKRDEVVTNANVRRLVPSVTDAETGHGFVNPEKSSKKADDNDDPNTRESLAATDQPVQQAGSGSPKTQAKK